MCSYKKTTVLTRDCFGGISVHDRVPRFNKGRGQSLDELLLSSNTAHKLWSRLYCYIFPWHVRAAHETALRTQRLLQVKKQSFQVPTKQCHYGKVVCSWTASSERLHWWHCWRQVVSGKPCCNTWWASTVYTVDVTSAVRVHTLQAQCTGGRLG